MRRWLFLALVLVLVVGQRPTHAQRDSTLPPITAGSLDRVYALATLSAPAAPVMALAFSPDGRWLAAGDDGGTVWLWPVRQGSVDDAKARSLKAHADGITALAFSPDGDVLASGGGPADRHVHLWAVDEGNDTPIHTFEVPASITSLAYAPRERQIAAGTSTGDVFVWDTATGEIRLRLDTGAEPVRSLFYTDNGATLLTGASTLMAWNGTTGEPFPAVTQDIDALWRVAYHAETGWFAGGERSSGAIRIWQATGDTPARTLRGHRDLVAALAFDPTGTVLASASADQTVRLWNLTNGDGVALDGHGAPVEALAFQPDGTLLASGGWDETIILWGAASEAPEDLALATIAENADAVNAEDFDRYMATLHPDSPLTAPTAQTIQDLFATYDLAITIEQADVIERNGSDIWVQVVQTTRRLAGPPFEDHRQTALYLLRPSGGVWKIYRTEIMEREYFS